MTSGSAPFPEADEAARPGAPAEETPAPEKGGEEAIGEEEEAAFAQLQDLLVGSERRNVERLESAVTGFISAVVRDHDLEELLEEITNRAVRERLEELRLEMPRQTARLVDEALSRELAIRRGDLPEQVGPVVDEAVAEHIRLGERHIRRFLEPVLAEVVRDLGAEGRQRLTQELSPQVLEIVRKRVEANRARIDGVVRDVVEEMVGGALRASAGRHLLSLVEQVRRDARRRDRKLLWVAAGVGALVLALTALLVGRQRSELRQLRQRVRTLEAAPATGPAAAEPESRTPAAGPPSLAEEDREVERALRGNLDRGTP
jgi:hypothetical protein